MKDLRRFETLVGIMDRLRGPDGCPWDREQTYKSLRGYLIEECYEVADAIDREQSADLCEELGDLLFQIVFLSRLGSEDGSFTADDVIEGISRKMIRRHPHVFGNAKADTPAEVLERWEEIKAEEKRQAAPNGRVEDPEPSVIDGIPLALPALLKAERLGTKAARVGFDWDRPEAVLEKVDEELDELRSAMQQPDRERLAEELGDTLFTLAMLARKLDIDPEAALERTNRKFGRRFRWIEKRLADEGLAVDAASFERLELLWQRSKDKT